MSYGDFKDLPRRTASDKTCNSASNPNYDGYINIDLLQWFITFLRKSLVLLLKPTIR